MPNRPVTAHIVAGLVHDTNGVIDRLDDRATNTDIITISRGGGIIKRLADFKAEKFIGNRR